MKTKKPTARKARANAIINNELWRIAHDRRSREGSDLEDLHDYNANFFVRSDGSKVADLTEPEETAVMVQQHLQETDKLNMGRASNMSASSFSDFDTESFRNSTPVALLHKVKENCAMRIARDTD